MTRLHVSVVIQDEDIAQMVGAKLTGDRNRIHIQLAHQLFEELVKSKAIKFTEAYDPSGFGLRVTASLVVGEEKIVTMEMPEVSWTP